MTNFQKLKPHLTYLKNTNHPYSIFWLSSIVFALLSFNASLYGQCDCTEYIYLNETTNGGAVHKFSISSNGDLTEIAGVNGIPWFASANEDPIDKMLSPHGLIADLNGFLYIGEDAVGPVRQLDCSGNITLIDDFVINAGGFNHVSIDNTLYINPFTPEEGVFAYDLCTGEELGNIVLEKPSGGTNWGLYNDDNDIFYATVSGGGTTELYVFQPTETDFINNTIYSSVMTSDITNPNPAVGSIGVLPSGVIRGVTTDQDIYIYIYIYIAKQRDSSFTFCGQIYKYDPNTYELMAKSTEDCAEDGTGYAAAIGIVYSETCNCLYVSTVSAIDDCVYRFDLDLATGGTAVGPVDTGTSAKGIAINKECCPNPSTQTINQVYCTANSSDPVFLNKEFPCDGIICGGVWMPSDAAAAAIYDDCSQSIMANVSPGCYSFTKSSDGTNANAQCGAYQLNFNLEILPSPEITVAGNQTICAGDAPTMLTITTTGTSVQWQMSTTSCTDGFTDIAGATSPMYMPTPSQTTYYRVVVTETAGCSDGTCAFESECITITVEDCPVYDVMLSKSVDKNTVIVGEEVVFTITVENLEDAVTNATVNDVLPPELTYNGVYTASIGTYDGTNWTIGDMAVGQTESIEITAIVNAEGIMTNVASVAVDETETNLNNNTDQACISVPIQVCNNEVIDVDLTAETGLPMYQWYKDGVAIAGATSQTYKATEPGTYTYTADGAGPKGDCSGELCCPIIIEQVSCCPAVQCLPVTVTKQE